MHLGAVRFYNRQRTFFGVCEFMLRVVVTHGTRADSPLQRVASATCGQTEPALKSLRASISHYR